MATEAEGREGAAALGLGRGAVCGNPVQPRNGSWTACRARPAACLAELLTQTWEGLSVLYVNGCPEARIDGEQRRELGAESIGRECAAVCRAQKGISSLKA